MNHGRLLTHLLITGGLLVLTGVLTIVVSGLDNAGHYALSVLATVDRVLAFLSPFPAFISWALVGLALGAFSHFFMWEARHFSRGQQRAVGAAGLTLLVLYFVSLPLLHSLNPEREAPLGPWWQVDSHRTQGTVREFGGIRFVWMTRGEREFRYLEKEAMGWSFNRRAITIRRGFWIGEREITWGQYLRACPDASASAMPVEMEKPVAGLSFSEAKIFAERFSALDGGQYRLPEKDEWQYGCSDIVAGVFSRSVRLEQLLTPDDKGKFISEDALKSMVWYAGTCEKGPNVPGTIGAESLVPKDMLGNVAEWCVGSVKGGDFALGGSWKSSLEECLDGWGRVLLPSDTVPDDVGIRLVRDP